MADARSAPVTGPAPTTPTRARGVLPHVRLTEPAELTTTLESIRVALKLPAEFPPDVEAEAARVVANVTLPDADLERIEFVTIDPEGSTDLDQAMFLERNGDGYRVYYAIADVPAFVAPGGAIDAEARKRGQTMYAPDGRIPLHPTVISEHAASLAEGELRGAFVWTFELDAAANVTTTTLVRARVRSRHRYSYVQVQAALDAGTAEASMQLLREVGSKRIALERARGGASLNRPDEEVTLVDGVYSLERRAPLSVEDWNAQISLMTGMAAADIMLRGSIGILRTMPPPSPEVLDRFRLQVAAFGCPWPTEQPYGEYLRGLDVSTPAALAALHAASALFRGAGYSAFDGSAPAEAIQAAVGAPYAHATAPLRRLVDRFVLVTCEALATGKPVPGWVRDALPTLPAIIAQSDSVASRLSHESVDAVEAALLSSRVGDTFDAAVIAARPGPPPSGTIQLSDPVVTAAIEGDVTAGRAVTARLVSADIATGQTVFTLAS